MLVLSNRSPNTTTHSPSFSRLAQMLDRRLAIAQKGLAEARRHLASAQVEDGSLVLEKIDEDLHLLRCRLTREAETLALRPSVLHECAN